MLKIYTADKEKEKLIIKTDGKRTNPEIGLSPQELIILELCVTYS